MNKYFAKVPALDYHGEPYEKVLVTRPVDLGAMWAKFTAAWVAETARRETLGPVNEAPDLDWVNQYFELQMLNHE
jgi:hypothetical protein